jgi:hypothetical protein
MTNKLMNKLTNKGNCEQTHEKRTNKRNYELTEEQEMNKLIMNEHNG